MTPRQRLLQLNRLLSAKAAAKAALTLGYTAEVSYRHAQVTVRGPDGRDRATMDLGPYFQRTQELNSDGETATGDRFYDQRISVEETALAQHGYWAS